MAIQTIKTIFQLKRGLSETWKTENPVLAPGEPGWELDTNILKIGDGVTSWNLLNPVVKGKFLSNDAVIFGNIVENTATGQYSIALGSGSEAKGFASISCNKSIASGSCSAAFGLGEATNEYSFALGRGQATGKYSFAGGGHPSKYPAIATGASSFAFGYSNTEASGPLSIAFGQNCKAAGSYSFVGGLSSISSADRGSFAYGSNLKVSGNYAVAFGQHNEVTQPYAVAFGQFNQPKAVDGQDYCFTIGKGVSSGNRVNAFAVGSDFIEIDGLRLTKKDLQQLLNLIPEEE